jgi:hypothetical protein
LNNKLKFFKTFYEIFIKLLSCLLFIYAQYLIFSINYWLFYFKSYKLASISIAIFFLRFTIFLFDFSVALFAHLWYYILDQLPLTCSSAFSFTSMLMLLWSIKFYLPHLLLPCFLRIFSLSTMIVLLTKLNAIIFEII